jgi:hypothetical protein
MMATVKEAQDLHKLFADSVARQRKDADAAIQEAGQARFTQIGIAIESSLLVSLSAADDLGANIAKLIEDAEHTGSADGISTTTKALVDIGMKQLTAAGNAAVALRDLAKGVAATPKAIA